VRQPSAPGQQIERQLVAIVSAVIAGHGDIPDEERFRFRIGINLRDVIVDDKDLYAVLSISQLGSTIWRSRAGHASHAQISNLSKLRAI
jgi:hypothetical protein